MGRRRGHGEGSIYQRKDGRWAASITDMESHKRKSFYGKTRREVQEKLKMVLREQQQGVLVIGPDQTVAHYIEHWLEEVHKPTIRLSTYSRYRKLLLKHIIPALGHLQLQKLMPQTVQAFYTHKLQEGLSPSTIQMMHALLSKSLRNAVQWGIISRNVCNVISPPSKARHEIQPLTKEQAQELLKSARGHRLECILTLGLITGMRRGELLALRWADINFSDRSLYIRRTVDRISGNGYVESPPKTASSRRKIVLPSFIIDVLKEHQVRQEEVQQKAGSAWQERDLVFPNTFGGFFHPSHLQTMFKKLLKDSGLPNMRFHDLRHSTATILLSMGVHPKVVQELLGHSKIAMTMDTYSHVLPTMQRDAMDSWNEFL